MKRNRIAQLKAAIEKKRRSGGNANASGHLVKAIKGATSLRVARDRAHEAMEKALSKHGDKLTPHMTKKLLEGVEQAYYNRDFHIIERDRHGY